MSAARDRADTRRARGITSYAEVLGVQEPQVPAALAARVGKTFAEEALQAAGGPASSPALSGRERSVAVLTALVAQGVTGDRLSTHLQLARQQGLDDDVLTALMALLANYVGYPRASLAMEAVHTTSSAHAPSVTAVSARASTASNATKPMSGTARPQTDA